MEISERGRASSVRAGRVDLRQFEAATEKFFGELGEDPRLGLACASFLRAHRVVMQRWNEILAPLDLTPIQMDLLGTLVLAPEGRLSGVVLRERLLMRSATLTHTLDALEARTLIVRNADPGDRRVVVVSLTGKGRKLISAAVIAINAQNGGFDELDMGQIETLISLLASLGGPPQSA